MKASFLTQNYCVFVSVFLLLLLPLHFTQAADNLALPSGDLIAPVIEHDPMTKKVSEGQAFTLEATVTDNMGIKEVVLYFKEIGQESFNRSIMTNVVGSDVYSITLPRVHTPGVEYYIEATDIAGNTLLHGHTFSPFKISVVPLSPFNASEDDQLVLEETQPPEKKISKWVWIGLGALVAGVVASSGGGGGGGGDDGGGAGSPTGDTGNVIIESPSP